MQSASRALSSSITLTRVVSGMSFFVLNMVRLLVRALENQIAFHIGSTLTPVSLYQAIFGQTGSPLTNAPVTFTLKNGKDGLEPGSTDYERALGFLSALEDVAIVAAPGSGVLAASQDIINSLIKHVSQQRAYRIAILETPPNQIASFLVGPIVERRRVAHCEIRQEAGQRLGPGQLEFRNGRLDSTPERRDMVIGGFTFFSRDRSEPYSMSCTLLQ